METCKSCNLIQWWKMLSESHRFSPLWRVISVVDILPHGAPSRSAAVWLTAQGTSANLISGCAGVKWELTLLSAFFKVDWGQQMSFAEVRVINWLESLLRFFLALTQRHLRLCQRALGWTKWKSCTAAGTWQSVTACSWIITCTNLVKRKLTTFSSYCGATNMKKWENN